MTYTKIDWDESTPITPANLDHMDDGIEEANSNHFGGDYTIDGRLLTGPIEKRSGVLNLMIFGAGGDIVLSAPGEEVVVSGDCFMSGDLDVSGSKNALVPIPDTDTDLRFAATESNTPGIMEIYCGVHEIPSSRQLTLRPDDFAGLPDPVWLADYVTIGRDPRVRLDAAGPRDDQAPLVPYGWAEWDADDPRIELRGPRGPVHVELRFIRADEGVDGWTHQAPRKARDEGEEGR